MANYVCHVNDRLTEGRTAILVRCSTDQQAVPVLGLEYLEATAVHVMLACKPMKIREFCHLSGPQLVRTYPPSLAAVFPSSWWVTQMRSM